ncbi:MAG TPA: DNA mismatch repair endonuclease MutL [Nitrospiraceae bacterium]|nr:DNA mismatch repair endonuclease MutL [Nitrospiraceae bacterium]
MMLVDDSSKIHVLPSEVIGRIAAGEVVERPAAVVKELIENSLDAGSTTIAVEIQDGGLELIRVTDNGEGMSRQDALLAFERHATSKLRSDADLDTVRTLGFRGEALPSIAAVSRVKISTAASGQPIGTRISIAGGRVETVDDAAGVPGTRLEVHSLFFNTPARKKFLKTAATEFSHITQVVQQASLAWPQVHFSLTHNGYEVLNCPAVSRHRDRVSQIYRESFMDRTLEIGAEHQGFGITGYIVDPVRARTTKAPQDLFVNRRPIRNPTVLHALSDGYSAFLAKGHHPVFVLFLDVDSRRVDVNVHPMKREVRFVDAETVHRVVRSAVRETLGGRGAAVLPHSVGATPAAHERGPLGQRPVGESSSSSHRVMPEGGAKRSIDDPEAAEAAGAHRSLIAEASPVYQECKDIVVPLGQMAHTFLIAQVGEELHVVDQHTAHERVLFERLRRQWRDRVLAAQPLLLPQPVEISPQQEEVIRMYAGDLDQLGLSVEPFGSGACLIRTLPAILAHVDAEALVLDLVDDLAKWNSLSSLEEKVTPIMASLACHGAVRAGRSMALPEIQRLVEEWVEEGRIMTCPHGRRVAFRLSVEELTRMFNRT